MFWCKFYKLLLPIDGQDWPEYLGRSINRVLFISYCIVFYDDCILMDPTCDSSYCSHHLAAVRHLLPCTGSEHLINADRSVYPPYRCITEVTANKNPHLVSRFTWERSTFFFIVDKTE